MAKQRKPIVNLDEAKFTDQGNGDSFQAKIARLSEGVGARKLGFNVVVLESGKKAWPYHLHRANEEFFLVLDGEGALRFNGEEYPLRKGDLVSAPPGPDSAHQIVNTSEGELRYLALSTREPVEIAEYPDTGKIGVLSIEHQDCDCEDKPQIYRRMLDANATREYWEDEP